ncbi:YtxH domain-containing protein [Candidatus Peregrinibacteria bacterium]|nr:MAG: YtxH domain-containing protein [Candidatus Peregrinibacteria bacterium]
MECRKTSSCNHRHHRNGKILFLGFFLGTIYGMLFVKQAGTELRKKIKDSKVPCHDIIQSATQIDKPFWEWTKQHVSSFFEKLFS